MDRTDRHLAGGDGWLLPAAYCRIRNPRVRSCWDANQLAGAALTPGDVRCHCQGQLDCLTDSRCIPDANFRE
jgi:hypothetical protein